VETGPDIRSQPQRHSLGLSITERNGIKIYGARAIAFEKEPLSIQRPAHHLGVTGILYDRDFVAAING
jgi:hypothetical protein